VQAAAVAVGEETDRGKGLMAEVTGWSSPVRTREGEGRCGSVDCGAGLGVLRRRACWPGAARGEGAPVLEGQATRGGRGSHGGSGQEGNRMKKKGGKEKKEVKEKR
jgi:hypothetical protein